MPQKSRRKKKYSGQRRPQVVTATTSTTATGATGAAPPAAAPTGQVARPRPGAAKTPGQMAPSLGALNVGREVKRIAIIAGAAVVVIIIMSFVLR